MITVLAVIVTVIILVTAAPAAAHKVVASVFATGNVIEGEVGIANGGMAKGVLVQVFDANGEKLGETTTDADGFFTYAPTRRTDLIFRADLGGGHVAEARISADELPAAVGAGTSGDAAEAGTPNAPGDAAGGAAATGGADAGGMTAAERQALAQIVRDEMTPLRREIAAYKEKNDLQSVLGGIGYIAGLFGLGFYLAARRRLRKS